MARRFIDALRRHWIFISVFFFLYVIFFHPIILMRQGFVLGDNAWQFYPWSQYYAEALKAGRFPLWTDLMHSGFPIFAEGQTGMLYLLNLVHFLILPFKVSYNFMILLHFFLGGLFTYLFARKKGLSFEASTLVSLAFTFGSSYAGCFYSIVTMRSFIWFPLALYLIEVYLERGSIRPMLCLAFILGQSWLSGFAQTAAYVSFFVILYFLIRMWEVRRKKLKHRKLFKGFAFAVIISWLIALPQLWATLELASHSTRVLQEPSMIFWGSASPLGIIILFLYSWGKFFPFRFYIGIVPLLLLVTRPSFKEQKIWWILAGLSFLLAMGIYNPLSWILTKLPIVSLLRNPSKVLFFTAFCLAMIAGFAFDQWCRVKRQERQLLGEKAARNIAIFVGLCAFLVMAARLLVMHGAGILLRFGNWYAENFVLGRSYHRWDTDYYLMKVQLILEAAQAEFYADNFLLWMPFFISLPVILAFRNFSRLTSWKNWRLAVLIVLIFDLFIFGKYHQGTGFLGNVGPFPKTAHYDRISKEGRWLELSDRDRMYFPPNQNMLTGHSIVGAYSPLVDRNYFLLTKDLGMIDDSFGPMAPDAAILREEKPLLDFLGVSHVTAPQEMHLDFLNKTGSKGDLDIFVNNDAMPEFSFTRNEVSIPNEEEMLLYLKSPRFRPRKEVLVEREITRKTRNASTSSEIKVIQGRPGFRLLEVQKASDGMLVRNVTYDRNWKVKVNGKRREMERVNFAFQGVHLEPGSHRVEFRFDPLYFRAGLWLHLLGYAILGLIWITSVRHERKT